MAESKVMSQRRTSRTRRAVRRPATDLEAELFGESSGEGPSHTVTRSAVEQGQNTWRADQASNMVGFESAMSALSPFGHNAVLYGQWLDPDFGFEIFLGYDKAANTTSQTTDTSTPTSGAMTRTTVYSGTADVGSYTLGGTAKFKVVQNSWFQCYVGGMALVTYSSSATYQGGTRTETFPDPNDLSNYTAVDTNLTTFDVSRGIEFGFGPKIGTEFYLQWFPHLALGFASGILVTSGGSGTTTSKKQDRTYSVINGVEQPPSVQGPAIVSTTEEAKGVRGATFGVGGASFQFTGLFTLRYIW